MHYYSGLININFKVQIETRLTPAIQKYIIVKNNLLKRFINGKDYRNMLSTLFKKKTKIITINVSKAMWTILKTLGKEWDLL